MNEVRPFHLSILDAIKRCGSLDAVRSVEIIIWQTELPDDFEIIRNICLAVFDRRVNYLKEQAGFFSGTNMTLSYLCDRLSKEDALKLKEEIDSLAYPKNDKK